MSNLRLYKLDDAYGPLAIVNPDEYKLQVFDTAKEFVTTLLSINDRIHGGEERYKLACKHILHKGLDIAKSENLLAKFIWFKHIYDGYTHVDMQIDESVYKELCDIHVTLTETYPNDECDEPCDEDYEVYLGLSNIFDSYATYCLFNGINNHEILIDEIAKRVETLEERRFEAWEFEDGLEDVDGSKYICIEFDVFCHACNGWLLSLVSDEIREKAIEELKLTSNILYSPNLLLGVIELLYKMIDDFK